MRYVILICGFVMCSYSLIAQETCTYTYENPNNADKVKVSADTILYKYQYMPIVNEKCSLQQIVNELTEQILSLNQQISKCEQIDIDKFLNIRDTTIFGSNFIRLSEDSIPISSRDFYLLIKKIHELDRLLSEVENMSLSSILSSQKELKSAKQQIDEVNLFSKCERHSVTDYLSESQKQFFRDLVTRYNNLLRVLSNYDSLSH